jgi:hypothetical protein
MNYGIYSVDRNGNVKLAPEALKLCPELLSVDKNYMKYIILVYDRGGSPLCRLPESERKKSAKRMIWKTDDIDPESSEEISTAIDYFCSLIYDPRQETVDIFKERLHSLNNKFKTETDYTEYSSLDKAISIINKRLIDSEDEFNREEEKVTIRGGHDLSLLEMYRRNRKLWTELKKPNNE